jgi:hypothetical protein
VDEVTVVDCVDGMAVCIADERAPATARQSSGTDKGRPGFVAEWIGAATVVLMVEMLARHIGPAFTDNLLIGPPQIPLVAFTRSSGGLEWTLGLASPLLAGLIFALAASMFSRREP